MNNNLHNNSVENTGSAFLPDKPVVFDHESFSERVMGEKSLMKAVVQIFLESVPLQIVCLSDQINKGDIAGARQTAHSIKGASASISAQQMAQTAKNMEQAAKDGNLEILRAAIILLKESFRRLVTDLKKYDYLDVQGVNNENFDS